MVEVEVQLLFRVGGWSDKTKLILISTLVEVVVEVDVELENILFKLKKALIWYFFLICRLVFYGQTKPQTKIMDISFVFCVHFNAKYGNQRQHV